MKNLNKITIGLMLFASNAFFACTNSSTSSDTTSSKDSAVKENKDTFKDSKDDKNNAQFVVDVAQANYYEIGLSKFAAKNTANKSVKDFANMMVMDHSGALAKLKAMAQTQNIAVPGEDSVKVNDKIKEWKKKTPTEFNKAYVDEMVTEHKNTVDKLTKSDSTITNADIRTWIDGTLPTVKEHLQKITDIQNSMKK